MGPHPFLCNRREELRGHSGHRRRISKSRSGSHPSRQKRIQEDHMTSAEYTKFKRRVMRRVYRAYILRTAAQPLRLEILLMGGLTLIGSFFVSYKAILANAELASRHSSFYTFIEAA